MHELRNFLLPLIPPIKLHGIVTVTRRDKSFEVDEVVEVADKPPDPPEVVEVARKSSKSSEVLDASTSTPPDVSTSNPPTPERPTPWQTVP